MVPRKKHRKRNTEGEECRESVRGIAIPDVQLRRARGRSQLTPPAQDEEGIKRLEARAPSERKFLSGVAGGSGAEGGRVPVENGNAFGNLSLGGLGGVGSLGSIGGSGKSRHVRGKRAQA
jgi:hypothetical protein